MDLLELWACCHALRTPFTGAGGPRHNTAVTSLGWLLPVQLCPVRCCCRKPLSIVWQASSTPASQDFVSNSPPPLSLGLEGLGWTRVRAAEKSYPLFFPSGMAVSSFVLKTRYSSEDFIPKAQTRWVCLSIRIQNRERFASPASPSFKAVAGLPPEPLPALHFARTLFLILSLGSTSEW